MIEVCLMSITMSLSEREPSGYLCNIISKERRVNEALTQACAQTLTITPTRLGILLKRHPLRHPPPPTSSSSCSPTERLTLTSPTRMERTVRPLHEMCELRIDTHRRRDLHGACFRAWKRRCHAVSIPAEDAEDFLLGAGRGAGVPAGWRDGVLGRSWIWRRESGLRR